MLKRWSYYHRARKYAKKAKAARRNYPMQLFPHQIGVAEKFGLNVPDGHKAAMFTRLERKYDGMAKGHHYQLQWYRELIKTWRLSSFIENISVKKSSI